MQEGIKKVVDDISASMSPHQSSPKTLISVTLNPFNPDLTLNP
jgi:hypothetical protein